MTTHEPVAIVGAGFAGLTAAAFLKRQGIPVVVYEASDQIAGLAATQVDAQGFTWDFGAHFITNRLAAALGLSAETCLIERYGESVRVGDTVYSYPLGLLRHPHFFFSALSTRAAEFPRSVKPESAADVFNSRFGPALASQVALPLLEAWSGAPAETLAPSVADKLQHSIAKTVWLTIDGRLKHRAVAIGYSHEMPETPAVWHVYPIGGVRRLCERLAEELGDAIHLRTPVNQILVESGRVVGIRAGGRTESVRNVVSTAPVQILAKLVTGTDALAPLARFRYRPMVFANLRFRGRGWLPDTMLWVPDRASPFFRLTEVPLAMPWLAPEGQTSITADLGCAIGDAVWKMDDAMLGEHCLGYLETMFPGIRQWYVGCRGIRTPIAYPVFLKEYEADRQKFERSTGVTGLYSVGRNGEFAHLLMEDVYWRTIARMRALISELTMACAA